MNADVNGLRLYYELSGHGDPLVLLHGGVGASEMFGAMAESLGRRRRLIGVHLQGHGRTKDIDRPLTFESMADDVAALVTELGYEQADFLGYSLGGGVAVQAAIRHPEQVRKLVAVSTVFKRLGFHPEVLAGMAQVGPESARFMPDSPLGRLYPDVAWPSLFTKLGRLLAHDYDWGEQVAGIRAETMLAYADADSIDPAHAVEFYRLLGGGLRDANQDGSGRTRNRLAIVPNATHYDMLTKPILMEAVLDFLAS